MVTQLVSGNSGTLAFPLRKAQREQSLEASDLPGHLDCAGKPSLLPRILLKSPWGSNIPILLSLNLSSTEFISTDWEPPEGVL